MSTLNHVQATRAQSHTDSGEFPPVLLGTLIVLLTFGALMVASTTVADGVRAGAMFRPTLRHLGHVAVGVVAMLVVSRIPVGWWETMSKPLLLLALGLLVVLLLPGVGVTYNGSTRWLALLGLNFQPSEPAKLFMVVYAAGYLTRKQEALGNFTQGVLIVGAVLSVMGLLMVLQPDLGSFVVIALTIGVMLFLAGIRLWHFLLCAVTGSSVVAVLIWSQEYRIERVTSFLNPWQDADNTAYQLVQGLIALGRGEWFGVGLGASVQKLYFLPHAESDFLLAIIGEELGFIGVLSVIALYALLLWRAFEISRAAERAGQVFAVRLAQGVVLLLVLQAMIHIGVNLGSLPTKGLTLPFMSDGGSSMVTSCVAAGMLLAIERGLRPSPRRAS